MSMHHDTAIAKQTILLNGAGTDEYNPILSGLPFDVCVRFDAAAKTLAGYVGTDSPPTTPIVFTQDNNDSLLYKYSAVAGIAPFDTAGGYTNVRTVFSSPRTGDQTIWEKRVYIATLPSHAVQVWDMETEAWRSVNYDTMPSVVPKCCQQCGIRFFSGWYDEFEKPHFGGAQYVSVYDYGTNEDDTDREYVKRDTEQIIDQYHYAYLEKHDHNTEEIHDFYIKFKTAKNSAYSVTVRIRVTSPSCWGFELKDPVVVSDFILE